VLEFRRQLEAEKKLLFESFDEMAAFREKLQRHLARWVRDHEKGQSRSRPDVPMAQPVAADSARFVRPASVGDPPSDSAAVRGADELVSEGRVTEANAVLARAFVNDDLAAMHRYASMQARAGNRSAAESSFRRLQEVAHRQGDIEWEVASLTGLAGVFRSLERRGDEEGCHREALHVREERLGPEHPDVAKSLNVLAEFLSENGRPQEALSLLERALAIQGFPDAA
jgi:Flp pilus assembly protein TadD